MENSLVFLSYLEQCEYSIVNISTYRNNTLAESHGIQHIPRVKTNWFNICFYIIILYKHEKEHLSFPSRYVRRAVLHFIPRKASVTSRNKMVTTDVLTFLKTYTSFTLTQLLHPTLILPSTTLTHYPPTHSLVSKERESEFDPESPWTQNLYVSKAILKTLKYCTILSSSSPRRVQLRFTRHLDSFKGIVSFKSVSRHFQNYRLSFPLSFIYFSHMCHLLVLHFHLPFPYLKIRIHIYLLYVMFDFITNTIIDYN